LAHVSSASVSAVGVSGGGFGTGPVFDSGLTVAPTGVDPRIVDEDAVVRAVEIDGLRIVGILGHSQTANTTVTTTPPTKQM